MKQRVVCVLGMHRSGTSCLTGTLEQAGLVLGDVFTKNPHNRKGNRESKVIMELHEDLLQANGGSWDAPPEHDVVWGDEHRARRDDIIASFKDCKIWGFKDPRALLVMDGWLEALPDMEFVGTFRNPNSVALSLERRTPNLGGREKWLNLWNHYNQCLLRIRETRNFPIVNFDLDDESYKKSVSALIDHLGLHVGFFQRMQKDGLRSALRSLRGNDFFDSALRSGTSSDESGLPDHVKQTYRELIALARL